MTRSRVLIPSFLPVDVLIDLAAVNQMDSYDSDSSNEGFESPSGPSTATGPSIATDPFNDPNYESYKRGQQFLIVDHTANQQNGAEASKI